MLGLILIGVAALLLLFLALAATRPAAYHVDRTLEVAASPDVVFGVLNDLRQFAGVLVLFGKPFEQADPKMEKRFAGPPAGVGQSLTWSGNREVGKGTLTIEESAPGQRVVMKLVFVEPMASTAVYALTLSGTATGARVTWAMDGKHNFLGKAFGLLMDMNKMLGADLEKGLSQLKAITESKRVAVAS